MPARPGTSFYDTYVYEICPKLQEIDLLIKTSEDEIAIGDAAYALSIPVAEVEEIMRHRHLSCICRDNFVQIMEEGSSQICALYRREKKCGSPFLYSRENISYIYNIDIDTINQVCDALNIQEMTWYMLPIVFKRVQVKK